MARPRVVRVLAALALTVCAFVALGLLFVPLLLLPLGSTGQVLLAYSLPELGFAAVGVFFVLLIGEDRTFIDFDRPNRMDAVLVTAGTAGLVAFNITMQWVAVQSGFESSTQFTLPAGVGSLELLLGLSIVFLLIVGPTEELFFRGVIQRYLDGALTRKGAYAWTGAIFAAFHLPGVAGTGGGPAQYLLVGGILFVVSWTLSWLYDRSRNLLVPILTHGCYNILVFASLLYGVMP